MNPFNIYEDLKEKIIWLELEPGCTLNLVELAKSYQVSRNPVTTALTRLESEEWVVRNGSHFVVSPLTLERMREITEIRLILEVQANIWAMHRISDDALNHLVELENRVAGLAKDVSNKEIVKLDVEFHNIIYAETQNQQLRTILDRLLNHYLRFWLSSPSSIKRNVFFKDMMEIIEAIKAKDEIQLKAACTSHIKASLDEIMGII